MEYYFLTSSIMEPCLFGVPSTLWTGTGIGWGSDDVSRLCFWTSSQLIKVPMAPESRSTVMEIVLREVIGIILTAKVITQGVFLERTYTCILSSLFILGDVIDESSVS